MFANTTNNPWKSYSSKSKRSPQSKRGESNDTIVYPKRLQDFFTNNYCIYHFMGKCTGGNKCESKHMDQNKLFFELQRLIRNPTSISNLDINQSNVNKFIKKNSPVGEYDMEPYTTSCWYAIRNQKCNNVQNGRYIVYQAKFKNRSIPIHICYPDAKKCKTRVTCGFHFDIEYSFNNNNFSIENVTSEIETPNQRVENMFECYMNNINPKSEDTSFDMKDLDNTTKFPSLNGSASKNTNDFNQKTDNTWGVSKNISTDITKSNHNVRKAFPINISIRGAKNETTVNINDKTKSELKELLIKLTTKNKELYYEFLKAQDNITRLSSSNNENKTLKYQQFEDVDDYMYGHHSDNEYNDCDEYDDYEDEDTLYFEKPLKCADSFLDNDDRLQWY